MTVSPSRFFSAEAVSHPSNKVQVYISRSTDPYLNLSIEHFLLQKSHPDSVLLLLYTNRPCVVIGRNQNPWVEVNLGLVNRPGILRQLRAQAGNRDEVADSNVEKTGSGRGEERDDGNVLLVRRRSGGGTVFHDAGNVNYSVICPPSSFDRNKHAEMVVRALRSLNIAHGVRVNERHDIVLDVSHSNSSGSPAPASDGSPDTQTGKMKDINTYKISGSAYKLTRTRSLHHGTCLLSSPHLHFLGQLLRSPAAPYIKARGVESVRSPVCNVGVSNAEFEDAVVAEFRVMYETELETTYANQRGRDLGASESRVEVEVLTPTDVHRIPEVQAGVAELRSRDWIYAQTPQFTFSSHPTVDDPRPRPDLPTDLPSSFFPTTNLDTGLDSAPGLQMTVRHAEITELAAGSDIVTGNVKLVDSLKGLHLHHIEDWRSHVGSENESVGRWLNGLFGVRQ
jgi:lipoate-protein ligase A